MITISLTYTKERWNEIIEYLDYSENEVPQVLYMDIQDALKE